MIRSKSALKHLTNVLEVLSLVPLFSVCTGILLACIYLAQKAWLLAACACLGFLKPIRLLVGKVLKGCASKLSKITNRCGALQRQVPGATANKSMKAMAQEATKTKTVTANSPKINTSSTTARQSMKATAKPRQATSSSQKSVSDAKSASQSPSVTTTKGSAVVADTAPQYQPGKLLGPVFKDKVDGIGKSVDDTLPEDLLDDLYKGGEVGSIGKESLNETIQESAETMLGKSIDYKDSEIAEKVGESFEKRIDSIMEQGVETPVVSYTETPKMNVKAENDKLYNRYGLRPEDIKNKPNFGI